MKDYYAILGISINAEPEVISAAYKALAKKYHPDVHKGGQQDSEERIREINEAYSNLSNKVKKEKYDKEFLKNKSTGSFDDFNNSEFEESSNIFDSDWSILVEVFPNAEKIRINLSKLSQKLGFLFQVVLIEKKLGGKADQVSKDLRNDFLKRYFGTNKRIQELASKALLNNEIEIAKEINKKITLLGDDAADNIFITISEKLEKKIFKNQKKSSSTDTTFTEIPKANVLLMFGIVCLIILISFIYASNLKNDDKSINSCEGSLKDYSTCKGN